MSPTRLLLIHEAERVGVRLQACQRDQIDGYLLGFSANTKGQWIRWIADGELEQELQKILQGIAQSRQKIADNLRHRQDMQQMIDAIERGDFVPSRK